MPPGTDFAPPAGVQEAHTTVDYASLRLNEPTSCLKLYQPNKSLAIPIFFGRDGRDKSTQRRYGVPVTVVVRPMASLIGHATPLQRGQDAPMAIAIANRGLPSMPIQRLIGTVAFLAASQSCCNFFTKKANLSSPNGSWLGAQFDCCQEKITWGSRLIYRIGVLSINQGRGRRGRWSSSASLVAAASLAWRGIFPGTRSDCFHTSRSVEVEAVTKGSSHKGE